MLECIVELLGCLLFGGLTLVISSCIVGSTIAALRAVNPASWKETPVNRKAVLMRTEALAISR